MEWLRPARQRGKLIITEDSCCTENTFCLLFPLLERPVDLDFSLLVVREVKNSPSLLS